MPAKKSEETNFNDMISSDAPPVSDDQALITEEMAVASQRQYSTAPEFDQEDLTYPRLRLAQGLTQEVSDGAAKAGDYVLAGYEPEAFVVLVPLLAGKARQMRDKDDNSLILCQSGDSKKGVGVPGGDCSSCPMAEWGKNPKDPSKGVPPACSLVYSYVFFSVTHDAIVSMDFAKSGTQTAKFLNTIINSKGLGKFAIKLSSKSQKGPRGQFYVPSITIEKVEQEILDTAQAAVAAAQ